MTQRQLHDFDHQANCVAQLDIVQW